MAWTVALFSGRAHLVGRSEEGTKVRARAINAALGFWLFWSAFLWPHTPRQFHNAWIVGALAVTAALAGLGGLKGARFFNAALGGWLIISALLWPIAHPATFWNHVLVGLFLAALGLAPDLGAWRRRTPVRI